MGELTSSWSQSLPPPFLSQSLLSKIQGWDCQCPVGHDSQFAVKGIGKSGIGSLMTQVHERGKRGSKEREKERRGRKKGRVSSWLWFKRRRCPRSRGSPVWLTQTYARSCQPMHQEQDVLVEAVCFSHPPSCPAAEALQSNPQAPGGHVVLLADKICILRFRWEKYGRRNRDPRLCRPSMIFAPYRLLTDDTTWVACVGCAPIRIAASPPPSRHHVGYNDNSTRERRRGRQPSDVSRGSRPGAIPKHRYDTERSLHKPSHIQRSSQAEGGLWKRSLQEAASIKPTLRKSWFLLGPPLSFCTFCLCISSYSI
ncbi:hypothetical protein LZ31DRAFT_148710 [Colletotrichum somersetense]|nr:hypothetical protein LZ31DRAFT_148710 [Colletotrichum somersetense]